MSGWSSPSYASWAPNPFGDVASLRLELHREPYQVHSSSCEGGRLSLSLGQLSVCLDGVGPDEALPEGPLWLCDAGCEGDSVHLVLECGDGQWRLVRGRRLTVTR
jgi:hypothetical protein